MRGAKQKVIPPSNLAWTLRIPALLLAALRVIWPDSRVLLDRPYIRDLESANEID